MKTSVYNIGKNYYSHSIVEQIIIPINALSLSRYRGYGMNLGLPLIKKIIESNLEYRSKSTAQSLHKLNTTLKCDRWDISDNENYNEIANYILSCLNKVCKSRNIHLERLYMVFIMPNEWAKQTYYIKLLMETLLTKIGLKIPQNFQDRVLLVTELEAYLSYNQYKIKINKSIPFIQNENRCVIYEMCGNYEEQLVIKSTSFQIKEDYSLRGFDRKLYAPKILAVDKGVQLENLNFAGVKQLLKHLVFGKFLNHELLINKYIMAADGKIKSVTDIVLNLLLDKIIVCP